MKPILLLCLLLPALAGCVVQPAASTRALTIVYMGNLDGELEPCGCTEEGDLGGILRQTTHIDRLRRQYPDMVMVHTGGLFNVATGTDRITSEYILSGMRQQGYDAVGVQWGDLAYGLEFLTGSQLPLVASNWQGNPFTAQRFIERGAARVAYLQWLDPDQSPYRKMKGEHLRVADDIQQLRQNLADARSSGALTILASGMSREKTLATLPLEAVDVVILQSDYEQYAAPEMVAGTLILQPGSRGQRIGRVTLQLDREGRIEGYEHQVTALPAEVPDARRLADWYEGFTDALRADYKERVAQRKAMADQPTDYVGERVCADCHKAAYATWRKSRHARAFSTLERENKAFDANCLTCHTVAYNEPGGFVDPEITPDRLNVQCEVCHGPGKDHAESAGKVPLRDTMEGESGPVCLQCHNRGHSPSFEFAVYWPKILHGLDPK